MRRFAVLTGDSGDWVHVAGTGRERRPCFQVYRVFVVAPGRGCRLYGVDVGRILPVGRAGQSGIEVQVTGQYPGGEYVDVLAQRCIPFLP